MKKLLEADGLASPTGPWRAPAREGAAPGEGPPLARLVGGSWLQGWEGTEPGLTLQRVLTTCSSRHSVGSWAYNLQKTPFPYAGGPPAPTQASGDVLLWKAV